MPAPSDMIVKSMWATTFCARHWREHAAEAPGIIECLYSLKAQQSANIASGIAAISKSQTGLFESDFDLFARDHAGLQKLKAFAAESVQLAVSRVNGDQCDPNRISVEIVDSWYHITNDGGFHDTHGHNGCSWCGIYYLQLGEAGRKPVSGAPNGANRFYSPFAAGSAYRDYGNNYLTFTSIDPPIADGMLLLFPSHLLHSALPYRGAQDRIVISFNSRSTLRP